MKKSVRAAATILAMALCTTAGAYAASNNQTISALLNRDITITYNGQPQTFQDVNGNAVYPITYNGSTYLPVRGVSDLLGVAVNWDQASNTVRLGSDSQQPTYLVTRPNSGGTRYSWIISDTDQLKFSGDSGIQEFQNGVAYQLWNDTASSGMPSQLLFDVEGYQQLTFQFACQRAAVIKIYDQDGKVLSSSDYTGGIVTKTIKLNGAAKISLEADAAQYGGEKVPAFFYEPTLS